MTTPVSSLDLAPTLLAWADVDADVEGVPLPGRSLLDLAANPRPRRPVLIHGIPSLQELRARRYRLDAGPTSLLLETPAAGLRYYDRSDDPAMARPLARVPAAEEARRSEALLQAVLAWAGFDRMGGAGAGGEGTEDRNESPTILATFLPASAARVALPAGSGASILGVWSGEGWRTTGDESGEAGSRFGLDFGLDSGVHSGAAPGPRLLLLGLPSGPPPDRLVGEDRDGGALTMPLTAARFSEAPGWSPLEGPLPRPGELFRVPRHQLSGDAPAPRLDAEARQELRALGYLR